MPLDQPSRPCRPPPRPAAGRTRAGLLRLEIARRTRPRAAYALRSAGRRSTSRTTTTRSTGRLSPSSPSTTRMPATTRAPWSSTSGSQGLLRRVCARARRARGRLVRAGDGELRAPGAPASSFSGRGGAWHTTTVRGRRRARRGRPPRDGRLVGPRAPSPGGVRGRTRSASSTCAVEALADVLADAIDLAGGARVIVKVNIEGEECPTILGTAASAWAGVDELYVETHPWAACGADELAAPPRGRGLHPRRERSSGAVAAAADEELLACRSRSAPR